MQLGSVGACVAVCVAAVFSPPLLAVSEAEPNSSCGQAQPLGNVGSVTVDGSIEEGDVDYFRVRAAPGWQMSLVVEGASAGTGTLGDSTLAVYDDACNQLYVNDDYYGLDSAMTITVPPEQYLRVAVSGFPDFEFDGAHYQSGSYRLLLNARARNGITGNAVTNGGQPFVDGWAQLSMCYVYDPEEKYCSYGIISTSLSATDGSFAINNVPLSPATYQVAIYPYNSGNHKVGYSRKFQITEQRQSVDLGNILVPGNVAVFGPADINGSGGDYYGAVPGETLEISYTVTNTTRSTAKIKVWTHVDADGLAGGLGNSEFGFAEPGAYQILTLGPNETQTLNHRLQLPANATDGTWLSFAAYASATGNSLASLGGNRYLGYVYVYSSAAARSAASKTPEALRKQFQQERHSRKNAQRPVPVAH